MRAAASSCLRASRPSGGVAAACSEPRVVPKLPRAVGQTRALPRPRGCGDAAPPFLARFPALGSSLHPAGPSESSSLRKPTYRISHRIRVLRREGETQGRSQGPQGGCSPPATRPPSARTGCAALRGRLQALLVVPARSRSHSGGNAAFQDVGLTRTVLGTLEGRPAFLTLRFHVWGKSIGISLWRFTELHVLTNLH